jgi:hypothetical protein
MKRLLAKFISFSVILLCASASLLAQEKNAEQSGRQGMLERIMHPNRESKSPYQGKTFSVQGGAYDKTFSTKDYSGSLEYGVHSYGTKGFVDGMKGWFVDHFFAAKKLPDKLNKANADTTKKFDSKDFKTKNFAELDKKSPYDSQSAFATREITMKGKTQGAIDNNPKLEDAVRKGLSIDDVRKLLNKGP